MVIMSDSRIISTGAVPTLGTPYRRLAKTPDSDDDGHEKWDTVRTLRFCCDAENALIRSSSGKTF
jgi:hypothetical protein